MTSNPKQLIDSEGEEMSLNKVDRALQSVGITLQDTQGQFRNFDDVIMELASVWDTLDNNTQRYIATVMAGNRQQSRFLALVSSYERYAELSEKAANAAGAGEEQFEKTLQGIEARTQQLQTSLQNLYTGAGLEELYGWLLGIADNVLSYYNKIADTFGNGIAGATAAVVTFGAQFYNIASIVTNVLKIIKAKYESQVKEITALQEAEERARGLLTQDIEQQVAERMKAIWEEAEKTKTKITRREAHQRAEDQVYQERKAAEGILSESKSINSKNTIGLIGSGISAVGSLLGTTISGSTGTGISAAGGVIGGAIQIASGNYLSGIMSLISSIGPVTELLKGTIDNTNKYTKAIENNTKAQEKYKEELQKSQTQSTNVSNLEEEIKKLKELEKKRYDSADSYQDYLDQMNNLIDTYPQLLDYYDDEGNAIAKNTNELEKYIQAQKDEAKIQKRKAIFAGLNVDEELQALQDQSDFKGFAIEGYENEDIRNAYKILEADLLSFDSTIKAIPNLASAIDTIFSEVDKGILGGHYALTSEKDMQAILGTTQMNTNEQIRSLEGLDLVQVTARIGTEFEEETTLLSYMAFLQPQLEKLVQEGKTFYEAFNELNSQYLNGYQAENSVIAQWLKKIDIHNAKVTAPSRVQEKIIEQTKELIKNDYDNLTTLEITYLNEELSNAFLDWAVNDQKLNLNDLETRNKIGDYYQKFYEEIFDADTILQADFYGNASKTSVQQLNEEIKNLDLYTKAQVDKILENLQLSGTTAADEFTQLWKDSHDAAIERFRQRVKGTFSTDTIVEAVSSSDGLSNMLLDSIGSAVQDNKANWEFTDTLEQVVQLLTDGIVQNLDEESMSKISLLFDKYSLSSISDLFSIIDNLPIFEGKTEFVEKLRDLASTIVPNFVVEFDSMTDTLTENFENLTKAISNAQKGMELSDAIDLADELGIKITDSKFQKSGGKYYFTDYIALVDNYLGSQEEIAKYLFGQFDINTDNEEQLEAYHRAVAAREQYYYSAREAYLAEGRLAEFLNSIEFSQIVDLDSLEAQLLSGDFTNLPKELKDYLNQLIEWYNSLGDDAYKAFIDSISSGETSTLKVTSSNKAILEKFKGRGVEFVGDTALINFAKSTIEDLQYLYNYIADNTTGKERESYLSSIDSELKSRNIQNIYKEVFNSYESFDRTMAEKFAKAVDKDLSAMNLTFDGIDRTFSMSIEQMKQYAAELRSKGASPEVIAELTDIIQDAYKNVGDLITKGLEGTLSNAEGQQLVDAVKKNFGINISLQQLNSGLGISRDLAIQLYDKLNGVSSIAGKIVFDKLKDDLTASGEECETILGTLNKIKDITDKINNSSENQIKILETQKKLYEKIAETQAFNPKAYDFMNRSIPNGVQSPFTFLSNTIEAISSIGEMIETGYADPEKLYTLFRTYDELGGLVEGGLTLFGQKFTGAADDFTHAWENTMTAWKGVGGESKVVLSELGDGVEFSLEDAAAGMQKGLAAIADQQIEQLKAVRETFVAIQALEGLEDEKKALLGSDGVLSIADMFGDSSKATDKWKTFLNQLTIASEEYKKQLNELIIITKDGQNIGIIDFLDKYGLSKEAIEAAIPAIQQLLNLIGTDIDFDVNNPVESLQKLLAGSDPLTQSINLQAVLDVSGGTIDQAEQLMGIINKALAIDGSGNITIQGQSSDVAFSLDIQGKGEQVTVKWRNGEEDVYTGGTFKQLNTWLKQKAKEYAERNGLIFDSSAPLTIDSISTNAILKNDPTNSNVGISIEYASKPGEYGKVTIGSITKTFGESGANYNNANDALRNAAADYVAVAGKLTDYEIETQSANVTNDTNNPNVNVSIVYTSKTEGYVQIGDKKAEFGPKAAIPTAGAALEKAAYDYDQTYGSGTLKDIPLGGKTVNITSSTGINYQFEFPRDTQGALSDIGSTWSDIDSEIGTLLEQADGLGVNLQGGIFTKKGREWSITLKGIDINGINTINYSFTLNEGTVKTPEALKEEWNGIGDKINDLAKVFEKAPSLPDGSIVTINKLENGNYEIKIDDMSLDGHATVSYSFTLTPNQLSNEETWQSHMESVRQAYEIYKSNLSSLAQDLGIQNFSITETGLQSGTLSVLMSLDGKTVVDCTYDIEWGENDADKASEKIGIFRTRINALKAEVEQFRQEYSSSDTKTEPNPAPIPIFPDSTEFDATQKIKITKEGYEVYSSNGSLLGTDATDILDGIKSKSDELKKQYASNSDLAVDNTPIDLFPNAILYNAVQKIQLTGQGYQIFDSKGQLIGEGTYSTATAAINAALYAPKRELSVVENKTLTVSESEKDTELAAAKAIKRAGRQHAANTQNNHIQSKYDNITEQYLNDLLIDENERKAEKYREREAEIKALRDKAQADADAAAAKKLEEVIQKIEENHANNDEDNNPLAESIVEDFTEAKEVIETQADEYVEHVSLTLEEAKEYLQEAWLDFQSSGRKYGSKEDYKVLSWEYITDQMESSNSFGSKSEWFVNWAQSTFDDVEDAKGFFSDIGINISDGVIEGILEGDTSEAVTIIDEIDKQIREYADIASPAGKFKPIGEYIAEGIGEGIKAGDLTPYIQALIDTSLGASLTLPQQKFNNLSNSATSATNKNSPQSLYNIIRDLSETVKTGFDNYDSISSNFSNVLNALDRINTSISTLVTSMSEQPKATEWYSVFDGISVHGDFWGEGNQIVMSDGKGGNIHLNLKEYITQFNQQLQEMQEIANNTPIVLNIQGNNTPFISKLNDAINKANRSIVTIKATMDVPKVVTTSTKAKGNVALGKGTLMGELGPELYVTGGHYYIAGRSGAEFVNLPDDAIVFNHLQTQRLLGTGSSGRGHAITNEKKATSYASGNVAMANASGVIGAIDAAIAAWTKIKELSLQDFATKAGRGGGGGGGKNGLDKGYIADLERWYNLLRKIEEAERDINYQEQLRNKLQNDQVANGKAIYNSQKKQIELLNDEIAYHTELAAYQERYYKQRQEDFKNSEYSRIFQLTDSGLLQYRDEDLDKNSNLVGLFALAALNETDASGKAKYTAEEQYNMLVGMNFGKEMQYTTSGEEINVEEEGGYEKAVETFWEKLNGWKDELDDLNDGYHEQLEAIVESETERNKLIQEVIDNQLEVENKVLEAIENREQAIIDELQDERNALAEAADKYINGLNQQLSKEREMYEQQESEENLRKLRRQLGILERSGGSSSQISSLRQQIASAEQDAYFDAQQKQIDAIKEASDLELERLDHQIEIMQETLAYQKENGLFWDEVTDIMSRSPEEIMDFITKYDPEWPSLSTLDQEQRLKTLGDSVEAWAAYYQDRSTGQDITHTDDWKNSLTTLSKISDTTLPEIIAAVQNLLDSNGDIEGIDSLIAKLEALKKEYGEIPEIQTLIKDLTDLKTNQGNISDTDLATIKADVDSLLKVITGDSGVTFDSLKAIFDNELEKTGSIYNALEKLAQALGYDISDTSSKTSDHTGGITSSSEGEKTSQTPKGDELWYYKDNNGNTRYARYDYIVGLGLTPIRRIDDKSTNSGGGSGGSNSGSSNISKSTSSSSTTKNNKEHGWKVNYNGSTHSVATTDRTLAETLLRNKLMTLGLSVSEIDRAMSTLTKYKQGGLANYTGLAMLHGSKSRPEAVFTADQTAILRNDILSDSPNSLLSLLQDFRNSIAGVSNTAALSASGSIIIENASVNMNIDSIANDYDAQRAGEQALNRMLEIARKTNVQSLRR